MRLTNTTLTNTNGSIFIDEDSHFEIASATLIGGTISGNGVVEVSGFSSVLAGHPMIGPGTTISVPAGDLDVTGVLGFGLQDGSVHGFDAEKLVVHGDVDFTGTRIDIRDRGLIAGTYVLVQWTGGATGVPVIESIPGGYHHDLILDPAAKTLKLVLSCSEFKIDSLHHDSATRTTTIIYQSMDGVAHSVKGTENLVDYGDLPDTGTGTGGLLPYIHQVPPGADQYFYIFSSGAP